MNHAAVLKSRMPLAGASVRRRAESDQAPLAQSEVDAGGEAEWGISVLQASLHGVTIEDEVLIGMGATLLEGVTVRSIV